MPSSNPRMAASSHFLRTLFFFGMLPSLWCVITYLHEGMQGHCGSRTDFLGIPGLFGVHCLCEKPYAEWAQTQGDHAVAAALPFMFLGWALERRGASVGGWTTAFVAASLAICVGRCATESLPFVSPWRSFDGRVAAIECGRPACLFASFAVFVWRVCAARPAGRRRIARVIDSERAALRERRRDCDRPVGRLTDS